jgi:hypothetical protein
MAVTNTTSTIASRLKEVYNNGITQLVPTSNELVGKRLKFKKELELGKSAIFDVQLSHENGFTVGIGELTLNAAVAQTAAKATVDAFQVILRSRVSYDLINRAKTTKAAFARFNDSKFIPMVESFRKREEIYGLYGQDSIGKVLTNTSGALVITVESWAPSLWLGSEGAVLVAGSTRAATATQHDGDLTITAVDTATRTVTVSGTSTSVVAGDFLFFKGDITFADDVFACPAGLMRIARNAGSLYGISAATYSLWSANSYDAGTSALTIGKILAAASKAADKGCDQPLTCLVPVGCFQNLVADQAALRKYDGSYSKSKAENGFESLKFYGATGSIEIVAHMFMKQGEALLFPERNTYLIGSTEMTNIVGPGGDIVFDLESTSAKEMRLVSEWTTFSERPGWMVLIKRSDDGVL